MSKKKVLVTGCAGFIGSNFVRRVLTLDSIRENYDFVLIDALTYAGNLFSIEDVVEKSAHLNFFKVDIRDTQKINNLFEQHRFDGVIHFAAESHVDRSISGPDVFVETNVLGTLNLLKASLKSFNKNCNFRYMQISTDEVYGSLKMEDAAFKEEWPLKPNSPYSSSKASADLFVRSYFKTYGLPCLISRCSNNYGPYQHPEKLIPLMIDKALRNEKLPVYGSGLNVRDWIHVEDHNLGVWEIFTRAKAGEIYNLGGECEWKNIDVVKKILNLLGKDEDLISFVDDRLGHDFRYAMDISKIHGDLGWRPQYSFEEGLAQTIKWYQDNQQWVAKVKQRASQ